MTTFRRAGATSRCSARRAGEHLRRYRRCHGGIDLVDYVVAATAEARDARLMTLNVTHFPMFAGLTPAFV